MNLGGHIGAGWLIAHAAQLNRHERRWIVLAGILSDVDAIFLFWKGSMDEWHRTFGHNVWVWLGGPLLIALFAAQGRKILLFRLSFLASASHVFLDLIGTGGWGVRPLWPFGGPEIFMSDYIAENTMKYFIQPALLVFFIGTMIGLYVRHRRTPLEAISPAVDTLLVNFMVLPWRCRCAECGRAAFYRCGECGRSLCPTHRRLNLRLEVHCKFVCHEAANTLLEHQENLAEQHPL